jgi:CRISPR/Cas system-associated exonuclease Cas4 (RecB family)
MNKELDLQHIVNTSLRQEREAEREQHQRQGWYATDLGQCLGGIYRQRLEGPPEYDDRRLRLFSVGNIFHSWLVNKVKEAGYQALTEERVESPEHHFSGRADLIVVGDDKSVLYEIKTMHSQGFWYRQKAGGLALPHHELQTTAYMWLLRDRFPDMEANICYVSKDDLSVLTAPVEYKEENVAEVKRQLSALNQAWEAQTPPEPAPAVIFDNSLGKWVVNWQAKYCNSHDQCTGDPEWLSKAEKEVKALNGQKGGRG